MAVVLVTLDRQNRASELMASAIVLEHGGYDAKVSAVIAFVGIAEITRRKRDGRCLGHRGVLEKDASGNQRTYTGHTHHAGAKDLEMWNKQDKSATTPSKN
jgi:hypothetical protein